jgi:hypothetical protein
MPTVYLPEYTLADKHKGMSSLALRGCIQGMLIMSIIEMLAVSGHKGRATYDLPDEYVKDVPMQAIECCEFIARRAVEMFDIRDYTDFDLNRAMLERLYHNISIYDRPDVEYVMLKNRWYVRDWKKHTFKLPKNEFGVLLYLDNPRGDSDIAVAVNGDNFKMLQHGATLARNTYRLMKEKRPSIKASRDNEDWGRLLKTFVSINIFKTRDRTKVAVMTALEAASTAQNLVYMVPHTKDAMKYNNRQGIGDVVDILELIAFQTRHEDHERRTNLDRVPVRLLRDAEGNTQAEMSAKVTALYYPQGVKKKKTVKTK